MQIIRHPAELAQALAWAMNPELRALLAPILDRPAGRFRRIVVVQRGDTLATVQADLTRGRRSRATGALPLPKSVRRHGWWLEGVFASPGAVVFSPDRIDIDPAILRLLRP